MEIVVPPPAIGVAILLGLPVLTIVLMLVVPGPKAARIVPAVLIGVVCAVLYHVAARPMRFAWDAQGVRDGTFGDERRIAWSDVRDARLVRDYTRSEYRPSRRTHGTYYSGYGSGTWSLADGRPARVFFEPGTADALLVTVGGERYLWAPRSFDRFLEAVRAHVPVAGPSGG